MFITVKGPFCSLNVILDELYNFFYLKCYVSFSIFNKVKVFKTLPIISMESYVLDGWLILEDLIGHVFALVPVLFLAGLLGGVKELGHLLGLLVQRVTVLVVGIQLQTLSG